MNTRQRTRRTSTGKHPTRTSCLSSSSSQQYEHQRNTRDGSRRERLALSLGLCQEQAFRERFRNQRDQVAKEQLVQAYLPLIGRVARRYADRGCAEEELFQEGVVIFLEALQESIHQPAMVFRATIRRRLLLHLETYVSQNGPLETSIAHEEHERGGDSNDPLRVRLLADFEHPPQWEPLLSLDALWSGHDETGPTCDRLCDPSSLEEQLLLEERDALLLAVVAQLSKRQQTVLIARFGLQGHASLTLSQVGRLLGVGPERVRQIESRALRHLRGSPGTSLHLLPWQRATFQRFKDYMKGM